MANEWPRCSVAELQEAGLLLVEDGNHGEYRPRQEEFAENGEWSFIRAADMDAGRVLFESAQKINDTAFRRIRKGIGKGGDVLFSHKGTVGKLAVAPLDSPPFVCSPQTTFWRTLDESRIDRRFLYYYMQSRAFTEQWMSRKGETDMADYVSLTAQRQFEIAIPSIDDQRDIASALGTLDDKIEQNRRTGLALEGLARATFKAWFVDFEPVKAKAAGQTSFPGMPPAAFAALPDRLTDSPLGPVPQGWHVSTVGAELKTSLGGTPSRAKPEYWTGGTVPWINSGEVNKFPIIDPTSLITPAAIASSSTKLIPARSTVIAITGATLGQVSILGFASCTNQSVVSIIESKELPTEFVYLWIRENIDLLLAKSTGAAQQHVNKDDVNSLPLLCPALPVMEEYMSIVAPMFDSVLHASAESRKLAALRDYLLPRLLSGRVRVRSSQAEVKP